MSEWTPSDELVEKCQDAMAGVRRWNYARVVLKAAVASGELVPADDLVPYGAVVDGKYRTLQEQQHLIGMKVIQLYRIHPPEADSTEGPK